MSWYVAKPEGVVQKRFEILQGDERTWQKGTIVGYGYGCVVKVDYEGDSDDACDWIDITKEQYKSVV